MYGIVDVILAGTIVVLAICLFLTWTSPRPAKVSDADTEIQASKDTCLNYLFVYYQLNLPNPYVTKPGYDEKRCHHCHFADGHGHDMSCPWIVCQPFIKTLYAR